VKPAGAILGAIAVVAFGLGLSTGVYAAGHDHSSHPQDLCHELSLDLSLEGLADSVTTLAKPDGARGPKFRLKMKLGKHGMSDFHGIKVSLDGDMFYTNDNAQGSNLSVDLDLSDIDDGDHYLLVNVCDHYDHVGISSLPLEISSPGTGKRNTRVKDRSEKTNYRKHPKATGGNDFAVASPYLGCCGRYVDWSNGNCGSATVRVN
jgi:hypothetical protein